MQSNEHLQPVLHAKAITKTFPGVTALDQVEFCCLKGEVHALVGENGAGKSTLVKILAGAYWPDAGELFVKGERVREFSPQHAQSLGIGIIYQELSLLPYMTVAENIFLGREPKDRLGLVDYQAMEQRAKALLDPLDPRISPRSLVYRLRPAQRQLVEIAKALSFNPDILIMDEPSSSLDEHELQQLFAIVRSLKERGVTIIYISHRMEEVFAIADRVTVLKDGRTVGTLPVSETNRAGLIKMMVGREVEVAALPRRGERGEVVLEVKGLTRAGVLHDINLTLHKGEIVGVAGLIGSGRTELARALFGADPVEAGIVLFRGKPLHLSHPRHAIDAGIALVPEDRKTEGLVLIHSVRENITLPSLPHLQRMGFVDRTRERAIVTRSVQELNIHTPGIEQQVAYLSGGNQQKVVLSKWLNTGPEVIIFDEPTRGIDVGAKSEIHALLRQLADSGKAILMISSELPEVLQLSDRIIVMAGGRIAGELRREEATEEKVLHLAYGEEMGLRGQAQAEAAAAPAPAARRWPRIRRLLSKAASVGSEGSGAVFVILALLILTGAFGSERFLTVANLTNLLRQMVIPMLLGIGQTLVVLSGGIDLSVSSVVTMTNVFAAGFMAGRDERVLVVTLLCLGVGLLVGGVNAFSVLRLRVPPIIATLGMMTVGQGVALIYTREPIGIIPRRLGFFAQGRIGPLPASAFFLAFVLLLAFILLYRTRYGRHLYAVGGDEEIARLAGIAVERVRAVAYLLSGFLAAVTGLYLTSRMGSGDPSVGPGLELDSIAAVLLGGTVLGGGRGGLLGTVGGVLVIVVLSNVFNQLGVHTWYQQIAKGLIIILAVAAYRQRG